MKARKLSSVVHSLQMNFIRSVDFSALLLTLFGFFFILLFDNASVIAQQTTLSVTATQPTAGATPGVFTVSRTGDTSKSLLVSYSLGGTAARDGDYTLDNSSGFLFNSPFVTGKVGQALNTDGQSVSVDSAPTNALKNIPVTIEAWVRPELRDDACFGCFLGNAGGFPSNAVSNDDPGRGGLGFGVNVTTQGSFLTIESPSFFGPVQGVTFQAGQWYHIALVVAPTNTKVYVNGQQVGSYDYAQLGNSTGVSFIRIGRHNDDDFHYGTRRFFKGQIDEVSIYNRALSQAEIQAVVSASGAGKCKPQADVPGCAPPPANLVNWFPLDGDAIDIVSGYVPGKVGQAFGLNGRNQYVQIPDAPNLQPKNLTVEGWVNFNSIPNGAPTIFGKAVGSGDNDSYIVWYEGGALHGVTCTVNQCAQRLDYAFTPVFGTWYHVAYTFDGANHYLYVNGARVASGANTLIPGYDSHPALIGADFSSNVKTFFFDGKIDEVSLYNRALSASEIQAIYNADSAGKCKPQAAVSGCVPPPVGLVAWYTGDGNTNDLVSGAAGTLAGFDSIVYGQEFIMPAGVSSLTINVRPTGRAGSAGKTVVLTLQPSATNRYSIQSDANSATVTLNGQAAATDLSLTSITPNKGGNNGVVTALISGQGIQPGASAKLSAAGQADIPGTSLSVARNNSSLKAAFDLTGKAQGVYDVVVTNPGGVSKTLPAAFTIQESGAPQLYVDVVGRDAIRAGRDQTYTIVYGNSGNIDAYAVPVLISFPSYLTFKPKFNVIDTVLPPGMKPFDLSQIPLAITKNGLTTVPLLVPMVSAGGVGTLSITLRVPDDPQYAHAIFTVNANIGAPFLNTNPLLASQQKEKVLPYQQNLRPDSAIGDCFASLGNYLAGKMADELLNHFLPVDCVTGLGPGALQIYQTALESYFKAQKGEFGAGELAASMTKIIGIAIKETIECGGAAARIAVPEAAAITFTLDVLGDLPELLEISGKCNEAFKGGRGGSKKSESITSGDPNGKSAAAGAGDAHYITGKSPLPYSIFFENKNTATAPAQVVTITDQLDANKVDLSTFALGLITFGDRQIVPPPLSSEFTTFVDLRPTQNIILKVEAKLNKMTGELRWTFTSLDPATLELTTDPRAGFLPPNIVPPQGEGSVFFTVMPKDGLNTNDIVNNQARIVFDVNAPIDTPVVTNKIDKTAPVSQTQVLPASVPYSFVVSWSGSDQGSGISLYTLYVSDNGAAYAPFVVTSDTSTVFTGQAGHTYKFYTLATDQVGNVEAVKTQAEATATVNVSTGNAIDDATFFVSQHYRDFLNRTPDVAGFNFWVNQIASCNGDAACIDIKRQNVSAAYFLSREFQETGFFVIEVQRAAFGKVSNDAAKRISYQQFLTDAQTVGLGFVDGAAGADQVLDQRKTDYVQSVVASSDFTSKYPQTLSATQFVDALFQTAGVQPQATERQAAISAFGTGDAAGRAAALRKVAESNSVKQAEFSPAFVLLQYFGYLRRNPTDPPDTSDAGYQFWLNKLNSFGGDYIRSEMVRSFIVSAEYRQRFGKP